MKSKRFKTRRDVCYLVGIRDARLDPLSASAAWSKLAQDLRALGDSDLPKFNSLLQSIRRATIAGRQVSAAPSQQLGGPAATHLPATFRTLSATHSGINL